MVNNQVQRGLYLKTIQYNSELAFDIFLHRTVENEPVWGKKQYMHSISLV